MRGREGTARGKACMRSRLTLEHLNQDTGLVVGVGRERLVLLGRDGGVALDQLGHDTWADKSKRQ